MSAPALLDIYSLNKSYGGRPVVRDLSLQLAPGDIVVLRGPNGAGKTTVLRCIVGAEEPDTGEIAFDGSTLDERLPAMRARIASVLDDMGWFPDVTAWEHLDLLARAHGAADPEDLVDDALDTLEISHIADQVPATLSSGQRRRLALASTLVRPFDLLLLDEPEQRLDVAGRDWLGGHLRSIASRGGGVLMASHDDDLIAACRARVVTMQAPWDNA